ncbi:MAG TPA: ATP synthase subunit I [Thermodesulfobacteriota bacterium]|nr:ATP synthase subunit I [Thermodesulfobacteriota bacterium]
MTKPEGKSNFPKTADRQETKKLISIEKRSAQILALLLLASLWFQSWPISLGLILGGGVVLLNFHWLWRIMQKYFFEKKRYYGLQALIRFLALFVVLFLIVRYGKVNPVAFLVGLSTLVMGIFFEIIRESLRSHRKEVR